MPLWLQHLLVLTLVAACVAYVAWQAVRTLRKGTGRLGACCSKGCDAGKAAQGPRTVFIPVESIGRRR